MQWAYHMNDVDIQDKDELTGTAGVARYLEKSGRSA